MIKTKFGSIISHKYNSQYICYDSSIQPILKDRIISSYKSDEFRLSNNSNFLDLNNGFIKKHFWRKGGVTLLKDNYFFFGLSASRPIRELKNYIDFLYIIKNQTNKQVNDILDPCIPIAAFVEKKGLLYKGDIVLSKMHGLTIDKYLNTYNKYHHLFADNLALCFKVLFQNGIYNFDMNLSNIIYNTNTNKIAFIDFDKLVINPLKKNNKIYISSVLSKFESSLEKYHLKNNFDWNNFISKL